jgi:hypothetical protein
LELHSFVEDLLDENLELDSRAILTVDKLLYDTVKLLGTEVKSHIEISKFIEDELLTLPVFEEEKGNKILGSELDEFFGCIASTIIGLLFAEVILEHKLMHRGIESDSFIWFSIEVITFFEDLHQIRGEFLIRVWVCFICILTDLHEEFDVVELFQLIPVLLDCATDEAMLLEFLCASIGRIDKRIDGISYFTGWIVLM